MTIVGRVDLRKVHRHIAICLKCKRKGLGYAPHPHAFGYRDHTRLRCKYCKATFKIRS